MRALIVTALAATLGLTACQNPDVLTAASGGPGGAPAGLAAEQGSPAFFRTAVGDRVLFSVDQSTLTPQARATLDGQAQWLAQNPEYAAVIEGHADEQGTREYNLALGARRANAVSEFLVSRGVAPGRLRTVSFGKERPIEVCSEEACYARNRRAVTVLGVGS